MDDKKQLSPSGLESAQPAPSVPQPHSARRWIACLIVPVCLFSLYHTSSHHPQPPHPHSPAAWKEWRAIRAYTAVAGACHRAKSTAQREATFLSIPSGESAREASHSFTADVHIAGLEGDRLSALRVKSQWEELLGLKVTHEATNIFEAGTVESREALMGKSWKGKCKGRKGRMNRWWNGHKGVESPKPRVWIDTYFPMLNYPTTHSLTMTPAGADSPSFVAKLLEDDVPEDSTSAEGRFQAPTFHGLSKNGTAKGQLVYAGRGTKAEFQALVAKGIDFTGKIAIVQYGGSFRGLKVASAAEVGAAGVLIYTDPIEDGAMTIEAGHLAYPHGPARQPSSVQRGSTQFLSLYPGDPLTPFTPAYRNSTSRLPRDDPSINIPSIPSLPISYEDALPLLKSLNGKGLKMGAEGRKEGGLEYLGVEYWSGPGDEIVEMVNGMEDKITAIWNTMAVIPGRLKDEVIVLGNHNDAWTFGAGDPNSGTASVHEIVKAFGVLLKGGWTPLRTIVLASWDAEEYGLIGSTEFGEDFGQWVKENVVAYLNVDVSVAGTNYGIGASPTLADLFKRISGEIIDPDQMDRTLLQKMLDEIDESEEDGLRRPESNGKELHIGPLGSGSDFTVFLQHLGIASVNVGYSRKSTDPTYHYHSIYDSAYWMDTFGDPTFSRHVAVSKVLGLATMRLADSLILPLNVTAYANELVYYSSKVRAITSSSPSLSVDLASLDSAIALVQSSALKLTIEMAKIESQSRGGWPWNGKTGRKLMQKAREINKRLASFEASFIDTDGLDQRTWYRNLVVAPGRDLGYGATTFPGLTESLTLDHNTTRATFEVQRLVKVLERASAGLSGSH